MNIEVFDMLGKRIEGIVHEVQLAGTYQYVFKPFDKTNRAGVYYLKFTVNGKTAIRKLVELNEPEFWIVANAWVTTIDNLFFPVLSTYPQETLCDVYNLALFLG